MTKYLCFSLLTIIILVYAMTASTIIANTMSSFTNNYYFPYHLVFNCVLLAISAGLYLHKLNKHAGVLALIGLSVLNNDSTVKVTSALFSGNLPDNYMVGSILIILIVTIVTIVVFYISIKSIFSDNKDCCELRIFSKRDFKNKRILSSIPTVVVIGIAVLMYNYLINNVTQQ